MFVDFVEKELAKHTATLERGKIEIQKLEDAGKTDTPEYKILKDILPQLEFYVLQGKEQLELLKQTMKL